MDTFPDVLIKLDCRALVAARLDVPTAHRPRRREGEARGHGLYGYPDAHPPPRGAKDRAYLGEGAGSGGVRLTLIRTLIRKVI
jgi:hypothetical protein